MGEVKGPQFTRTYEGPTAFADARRDMKQGFDTLAGLTGAGGWSKVLKKLGEDLFGFGSGGSGTTGLGSYNYGSSPARDDTFGV